MRTICSEVRATPSPGDNNISYYARHKGIESTSATLLTNIKPCIMRCHHQHVPDVGSVHAAAYFWCRQKPGYTRACCETTPHSMVVQSSSRLSMSTVSQAHTTKCCASASRVGQPFRLPQERTEIGTIFSWADNYDLYIASPKGMESTHAIVVEFTQHPSGIIKTGNIGVMQQTIPRLKKHEASSV